MRNQFKIKSEIDISKSYDIEKLEIAKYILSYRINVRNQIKDIASVALNLLFIANGGAVIAVLTLVGSALSSEYTAYFIPLMGKISRVAFFYAIGSFCALLSMIIMYVIYEKHLDGISTPFEVYQFMKGKQINIREARISAKWDNQIGVNSNFVKITTVVALISSIISVIMFCYASFTVSRHISTMSRVLPYFIEVPKNN
jgi:hypothetical protein